MNVQPLFSSNLVFEREPSETGCLHSLKNTCARIWKVLVEKGTVLTHTITFLFFRTVGFFSQDLALKLEAGWGYLKSIWASVREEELVSTVEGLQEANQRLQRERSATQVIARAAVADNQHLSLCNEQTASSLARIKKERHDLLMEKGGIAAQMELLRQENGSLRKENETLQKSQKTSQEQHRVVAMEATRLEQCLAKVSQEQQLRNELRKVLEAMNSTPEERGGVPLSRAIIPALQTYAKIVEECYQKAQEALSRVPTKEIETVRAGGNLIGAVESIRSYFVDMGYLASLSREQEVV